MSNLEELKTYYKNKEKEKIKNEENILREQDLLNEKLSIFRRKLKIDVSHKFYLSVINKMINESISIDNDIVISRLPNKQGNRMLRVKCELCGTERDVQSKKFFSNRPLKEGMCNCRKYRPQVDTSYTDTIRGSDIFVGLSEKSNGWQYIWIKCLECGKYRRVKGEEYLKGFYIDTCDHKKESEVNIKQFDFDSFYPIIPYYNMDDFFVGQQIENFTFLGFKEEAKHIFAYLQCNTCGKKHRISINEFLRADKHTLTFYSCSCNGLENIQINGIYGNLKVLSFDKKKKKYRCKCICEKSEIVYRDKYQLLNGISLSCGCLSKDLKSKYNIVHYIGKEFNNLKVEGFYKLKINQKENYNDQGVYWLCTCKLCGKKVIFPSKHIIAGAVTDCGCKNRRFFEEYKIGDFVDDFKIVDIIRRKGEGTYWVVSCPICGTPFVRLASNICLGHYKSCGCLSRSYGELLILKILKKHKLNFREQVSFTDLKNGTLRFDFMVEKEGIHYLIEFDGMEHFSENSQFGAKKENFISVQYNDNLKNQYAKLKEIPLLRIPYILDKKVLEKMILDFIGG